jgi:hypothetical protein
VRTVDREKLRDKARLLQMKDNMRLALCARIQQTLRKSPKVAEELAGEVMRLQQQRSLGDEISDEQLRTIVDELCMRRHEQKQLASRATQENNQQPSLAVPPKDKTSGRRSSSSGKEPSGRTSGSRGRHQNRSSSKQRTPASTVLGDDLEDNVYLTQSQIQQLSTGFRLPPKVSPQKDKSNGIWEEIVKYSTVEEQIEAQRKRQARDAARLVVNKKLEEQVHMRHQQLENEKRQASAFYEQSMAKLEQDDERERQKERTRLQQAKQLTSIQDEQRRAKQQQRERELAIKKTQEQRMADQLRKQAQDELAREQARKDAEKERIRRVLHENEEDLRRKQQQKEKDRELEMKLAADYVRMEEAKEIARKKQLEDMAANIKKKMKFFGDTAIADMNARAKEEEDRVRKYQDEYDRQQAEALQKKKDEAERRSAAQQECLRLQMVEKKAREEANKRDLNKQAELWKQERLEAERREKMTKQQRVLRNMSQQEVLKQQMREKESRSLQADQTSLEVQLNAKLLDKIRLMQAGASVVSETQHRSREVRQSIG